MDDKEKNEAFFDDDDMMKVIIDVPKSAFHITLDVKCCIDDKVVDVQGIFDNEAIREVRNMYLELDPDDDAFGVYRLTEKGREMFEELEAMEYGEI